MGANISTSQEAYRYRVIACHSSTEWRIHFENSKVTTKLIVIDFSASWCAPCRYMEPIINQFASDCKNVDFFKIDVEELNDVAQEFGVQATPTFVLMKQGKVVDKIVGAQKDELKDKIENHK
ncbi:hypothetical protein ACH5RR_035767 [Cinchona calisaya]|uniref:Thioredoxin domain-containing protein n=1 Tax=Cinchona calisaya TaxID=153742 RepID=A0ABD2Y6Q4_9GENT